MGLLVEGKALSPEEMKDVLKYIREHGVIQFLNTWKRVKDVEEDELRFGDEIECGLFVVDHNKKTVKLTICGAELRTILSQKEINFSHESEGCTWHPEWGSWMIESTPSRPYSNYAVDLLRVERNMILRRRRLLSVLNYDQIAPTITCFPLMGVGEFIHNPQPFSVPYSHSQYIPDYVINPHPRFAALVNNIRARRGELVDIRIPLFRDKHTPEFLLEGSAERAVAEAGLPEGYRVEDGPAIHMDMMGFGMGMSCLQVTFQARDIDESRYMYDQLAVLAPIMMAMTAATPFFKGRIADTDARWNAIAQSVDDRTAAERGQPFTADGRPAAQQRDERMVGAGVRPIPKSRYDSISTYIYHCRGDSACHRTFARYNDVPCPVDEEVKVQLRAAGIDENLAHHVAHLYCRDPLVAFEGQVELDDAVSTDHFESIQSTNWQSVRWKPPPPRRTEADPHIGWRTEFRTMEVQLTDFENAAFTVFVVLITRVVLAFDLSFYIPLSKVDENMQRAHVRDAVRSQRFFFRKFMAPPNPCTTLEEVLESAHERDSFDEEDKSADGGDSSRGNSKHTASKDKMDRPPSPPVAVGVGAAGKLPPAAAAAVAVAAGAARHPCSGRGDSGEHDRSVDGDGDMPALSADDSCEEMTMEELFCGKGDYFPGLLPLVHAYLEFINCDSATYARVAQYLDFIEKRAKGELITPATWMRNFVNSHQAYKGDSVISPEIAHDLMMTCKGIGEGTIACPELLGTVTIDRVRKEDAYGTVLAGKLSYHEKTELLRTLVMRGMTTRPANVARGKSRSLSVTDDADPDTPTTFAMFPREASPSLGSAGSASSAPPAGADADLVR